VADGTFIARLEQRLRARVQVDLVVSDFPWLSFRGAERPFRDISGTVLAIPEEVDREYAALRSRIAR
jgi:hypothetical protein